VPVPAVSSVCLTGAAGLWLAGLAERRITYSAKKTDAIVSDVGSQWSKVVDFRQNALSIDSTRFATTTEQLCQSQDLWHSKEPKMDELTLATLLPLLMFVPFFVILLGFRRRRRNCPDCGEPLPRIQSPFTKTRRQWVEGGYLCGSCGCETDLAGQKVAPGTGPRPGWMVRSVLLVMPPAIAAVILLLVAISLSKQEAGPPVAPDPLLAAPAGPGR
jgi:hypothetical protein